MMKKKILPLILIININFCLAQNSFLLKGVSIVPLTSNQVLKNLDVLIQDGKIAKISKIIGENEDCTVINCTGKFLMSGLVDMHAHLPNYSIKDITVNHYLLLQLASGVTTLRSMRGDYDHLLLKDSINRGYILSPNLYLSAPPIRHGTPIDSIAPFVVKYKKDGFDFIKVLSVSSEGHYTAITNQAKQVGFKVVGHVPMNNLSLALEHNQYSIEHLQGYTNLYELGQFKELQRLVQLTKTNGIYNCPTMDWYFVGSLFFELNDLKKRAGLEFVSNSLKQKWESDYLDYKKSVTKEELIKDSIHLVAIRKVMQLLKSNQAKIILSPDASSIFQVPGFGLVEEMKLMQQMGFSNYDILRAATIIPLDYFQSAAVSAGIKEGSNANLILLNANPLEDIKNIEKQEGIFLNGKWLSQEYLIGRLKSFLK